MCLSFYVFQESVKGKLKIIPFCFTLCWNCLFIFIFFFARNNSAWNLQSARLFSIRTEALGETLCIYGGLVAPAKNKINKYQEQLQKSLMQNGARQHKTRSQSSPQIVEFGKKRRRFTRTSSKAALRRVGAHGRGAEPGGWETRGRGAARGYGRAAGHTASLFSPVWAPPQGVRLQEKKKKKVPNHQREQTMMRAINLFRLTEIFTIWLQVEELNIFSCN